MSLHKRISQPQAILRSEVLLQMKYPVVEDSFWDVRRPVLFAVEREIWDDVTHQLGADLNMRVADHER